MAMTFGIHLGHLGGPWEEMRKLWRFADAHGFDWFSIADHFQESPPQGGDLDAFEGVTTLAAAAMDTRHVRLGSMVFCVVYRNPGLLAKSLTAIDHMSGGRVECSLGAGWHQIEAQAFGYDFPSIGVREDMLEEYAQILRALFDPRQRRVTFAGKHFKLDDAPNNPKPIQPHLPIWIGGRGEKRTLRAVARWADGWNGAYIGPDEWKHKSSVVDQWCDKEGRDPKAVARTVNLGFYLGADAKGAARGEALYQRHFGGRTDGRQNRVGFLRGTPEDVMDMVGAFRDAGCSRLNLAFREGPYDWDALHAFADRVLPAFGARKPTAGGTGR